MKLYKGNIIYTKNKDNFEILENGFILEEDGVIIEVDKNLSEKYSNVEIIDYSGSLLIPGFVDLHFHAVQYGNLGIGLDEELLNWLNIYTFKEEEKFSDLAYARLIFEEALNHIIRNGTTRVAFYSSIHEEATELLMELCEEKGIGAFVGKVNMDRNTSENLLENTEKSFEITKRLINKSTDKVKSIITPRFVPSCSEELMDMLGNLAQTGLPVQTHISENESEIKWVEALHPEAKNYLDVYDKCNLIGDKTILAHCVYCTDDEKDIIKERGSFVAHCPAANYNLTSGIMDVKDYIDRGVKVGLGTDVGAGHTASIKDVMVLAIQMSKTNRMINRESPTISFSEAFYLATKGGGEYFGNVGSFEKGYDLDMLVVESDYLTNQRGITILEKLQKFIYSGDDRMIIARYCQGEKLNNY